MKRAFQAFCVTVLALEALLAGQGADVTRVLTQLRAALGADKPSAARTVSIEGRMTRSGPNNTSTASDFEMAIELPDKFMKREVFANIGGMALTRRSGFNGALLIDETDAPPGMSHGGGGGAVRMMQIGPGTGMIGGQATPEQLAAQHKISQQANRREFARLALGMFGDTTAAFPVEFAYVGQAEAADGKAEVLDVRGPDGFVAKFFIDATTHLPLMLSWMDKEPLRMTMGSGNVSAGPGDGNVQTFTRSGGTGSSVDMQEMQQQMAERMKEAEAKRRTVEYRVFYADYKTVSGVQLPTRIQRMVDGEATDELALEKIKVNQKIDQKKFEPSASLPKPHHEEVKR
jgi:hypothetical protein